MSASFSVAPVADPARFPRLAAYLAALPDGLASHPASQARTSMSVAILEALPELRSLRDGFPPALRALLTPPTTLWTPEVHLAARMIAAADLRELDEAEHAAFMREVNRTMFGGIAYRAIMAFLSPASLLARGPERWASLHRGTRLTVERVAERECTASLAFPQHLVSGFGVRGYGAAFEAALEHSRARDPKLEVTGLSATELRWRATWS
jgi:hypothetical protein